MNGVLVPRSTIWIGTPTLQSHSLIQLYPYLPLHTPRQLHRYTVYHGARGRYHYFLCLQWLLRNQVATLIKLWNLPPEFEVGHLVHSACLRAGRGIQITQYDSLCLFYLPRVYVLGRMSRYLGAAP